jgi:hypothetical protein
MNPAHVRRLDKNFNFAQEFRFYAENAAKAARKRALECPTQAGSF